MTTLVASAKWMTRYVRDPREIEKIDFDRVIEDLCAAGPDSDPAAELVGAHLSDYDHVVLATDQQTGRCVGLLGMVDRITDQGENFLLLQMGYVAAVARRRGLMRRMLAFALLRVAGEDTLPAILVTRTSSPLFYQVLHGFARRTPGAAIHPDPTGNVTTLATAALCRRVARNVAARVRFDVGSGALRGGLVEAGGLPVLPTSSPDPLIEALFCRTLGPTDQVLALLDLRASTEADVVELARRIHRRPSRATPVRAMPGPACRSVSHEAPARALAAHQLPAEALP